MTQVTESDLALPDGGVLHVYDTGPRGDDEVGVVWHHGTPNTGLPPTPLFDVSERLGVRWVSWDRPGYGGSSPSPDRPVASAATYAAAVADHLGLERFAVMGHSGGGPHALACAALLPERVSAALVISSLAPYDAEGLDHAEGMGASGVAALATAAAGRAIKERHEAEHGDDYDPEFTPGDLAMFEGEWRWFVEVVRAAAPSGPAPAVDDDLAFTAPWGFDPADLAVPTLLLQGDADRIVPPGHARWLAERIPGAELRLLPGAGHVSVVRGVTDALEWLAGVS